MNFDPSNTWVTQINNDNYIQVKDADGSDIPSYTIINSVWSTCNESVCSVSFFTNHFTEFALKPFLTAVHIESNHPDDTTRVESGEVVTLSFTGNQNLT